MPIKMGTSELFCYLSDDGEYKPIGHISEEELTLSSENELEIPCKYFNTEPLEFNVKIKSNVDALFIFLSTGNDLYLRFPKKLRRRRKR